jgi:branched-subunit amino acid aminotransferase/4-amino-4-deoxychorismate lyase
LDAVGLDPRDRGFTLGDGLFETMLWTGETVRFGADHMARLAHGAAWLGLPLPRDGRDILEGMRALALAGARAGARAAIRLTLTRGVGPRGLAPPEAPRPRLLATLAPAPTEGGEGPVRLHKSPVVRAAGTPSARFKTLSYIDNVVALRAARAAGMEDAVLCNWHGRPACATAGNLIVILDGRALTPPVGDGALPGIVRGRLLAAGLVEEAEIEFEALGACQAMATTNALVGVRPVDAWEGRALDRGDARLATMAAFIAGLTTSP